MDAKKREMVIKALECWASGNPCIGSACAIFCDSTDTCDRWIGKRALALIKAMAEDYTELDEKYRALYDECERYKRYYLNHEYDKMEAEVRADTVRKMQDSIAVHFGTYTTEDYVRVLDVIRVIYSLGEELLNEGEEVKDDTVDRR